VRRGGVMSPLNGEQQTTVEALRDAFDQAFAEPFADAGQQGEDLLLIQVGGRRCAVRMHDTGGVRRDVGWTPLPGPHPALLGLARVRSTLVGVYDLATLLGSAASRTPEWLLLTGSRADLAFAMERLVGHKRGVVGAPGADGRQWITVDRELLEVIDLQQLVASLTPVGNGPSTAPAGMDRARRGSE